MTTLTRVPLLLALALTLGSCGQPGSGFANPFVAQITLTATPQTVTLTPGASQHVSVTAQADGRDLGAVSIAALTSGPVTLTPDATGLTVTATSSAQSGTYALPLTGSTPGGSGHTTLNVTVNAGAAPVTPPASTGLAISVSPTSLTLAPGDQTRVAISAPAGTALTISDQGALSTTLDGQGGLLISVPATAPTGVYVLSIAGKNGTLSGAASLTVTITKGATGK